MCSVVNSELSDIPQQKLPVGKIQIFRLFRMTRSSSQLNIRTHGVSWYAPGGTCIRKPAGDTRGASTLRLVRRFIQNSIF